MVELVSSISELLSEHGGWGIAGLTCYICRWLYLKRESDKAVHDAALESLRQEYGTAMEARHAEFTALLRETQDTLSSLGVIVQKCQGANNA